MSIRSILMIGLATVISPAVLAGQRSVPDDYGQVHGVVAIDLRSLQRGDTLWQGAIQDYQFASVVDLESLRRDSTGKWRRVGQRVEMIVRHDSLSTVVPHCEIDSLGAADTVIGLAPYPLYPDAMMGRVTKAWIVSISSRRFIPFPAARVRCENPYVD